MRPSEPVEMGEPSIAGQAEVYALEDDFREVFELDVIWRKLNEVTRRKADDLEHRYFITFGDRDLEIKSIEALEVITYKDRVVNGQTSFVATCIRNFGQVGQAGKESYIEFDNQYTQQRLRLRSMLGIQFRFVDKIRPRST